MEEQTADIEVTVKTLDSQSRTYTVGAQVSTCMVQTREGILILSSSFLWRYSYLFNLCCS